MVNASVPTVARTFGPLLAVSDVCLESDLTPGQCPDLGTGNNMSCITMRRRKPASLEEGERQECRHSTAISTAIDIMLGPDSWGRKPIIAGTTPATVKSDVDSTTSVPGLGKPLWSDMAILRMRVSLLQAERSLEYVMRHIRGRHVKSSSLVIRYDLPQFAVPASSPPADPSSNMQLQAFLGKISTHVLSISGVQCESPSSVFNYHLEGFLLHLQHQSIPPWRMMATQPSSKK